ncbi:MAG TPA: asparaginase domain-containing protein, partial [Bacillaceae bacterium]
MMSMKKILIIHTGGTISMQEDTDTGSVGPSDRNPLLGKTDLLGHMAELIEKEPFHLPSPH